MSSARHAAGLNSLRDKRLVLLSLGGLLAKRDAYFQVAEPQFVAVSQQALAVWR